MLNIVGSCPLKTYPLEYMATLVNQIAGQVDVNILFNFLPHQKDTAQKIYDLCNDKAKENIFFELSNYDLRTFILIMDQCDAIIGNEGGAIHIAKALNKSSFTIFLPGYANTIGRPSKMIFIMPQFILATLNLIYTKIPLNIYTKIKLWSFLKNLNQN